MKGAPQGNFLLFSDTAMVESGMFKRDQNMIDEKKIELYGKMTAYAVLHTSKPEHGNWKLHYIWQ